MTKRKLLLADDSITIQKVVNLTFADEGVEVVAVGDGDAAMKKFVEAVPDLVLADVNMPGLNGYRICEMIKQDAETKHIPVILLVGSFEPFDASEARRVGADDFLTKPFQSIRQLVNKVSELLEGKADEQDFFAPIEKEAADGDFGSDDAAAKPANEIEEREKFAPKENFGDAALDDEMIQTSQFAGAGTEPIVEYESEPIPESDASYEANADEEEAVNASPPPPPDFEESPVELKVEMQERRDNFSSDFKEEPLPAEIDAPESQPVTPSLMEQGFADISRTDDAAQLKPPVLNLDNFDLLEFSRPATKSVAARADLLTEFETSDIAGAEAEAGGAKESIENTGAVQKSKNLSPETIEAIADKVIEKIFNRFAETVVREVVRQMEEKN